MVVVAPLLGALLGLTLLRDDRSPVVDSRLFEPDFLKIRCPRCQWQPQKTDRWLCSPGCQHCWNTFERPGLPRLLETLGGHGCIFAATSGRRTRIGTRGRRITVDVLELPGQSVRLFCNVPVRFSADGVQ